MTTQETDMLVHGVGTSTVNQISPRYSEKFRFSDADVTICSSDGVLFRVHKRNLSEHSEAFPGDEVSTTNDEYVGLQEKASTLQPLFQFMYRQEQPDVSKMAFGELAALAEAVEKYTVYPAMQVCKMELRNRIPYSPMGVLAYATKHKVPDLYMEAAPLSTSTSFVQAEQMLGDSAHLASWVAFRDHRKAVVREARQPPEVMLHKGGRKKCGVWKPFRDGVLFSMDDLCWGNDFERIFAMHEIMLRGCFECAMRGRQWRKKILSLREGVKGFDAFLQ